MRTATLKWLLISSVIAVSLWAGWKELKAQGADLLPIKYVRIEGVFQYIAKDALKQALLKQVMTGFFNVDVQSIRQLVLVLPWISQVKVKRVWSDTIEIKIYEQYPVARWKAVGLLNEQGDLFMPDNLEQFSKLPLLEGPEDSEKKLMDVMKTMQTALVKYDLSIAEFKVNERRAWGVVLSNGLELTLGQNQPLQKFKRFLTTLPILGKQKVEAMQRVDLRYPNGYAVTWKQGIINIRWSNV